MGNRADATRLLPIAMAVLACGGCRRQPPDEVEILRALGYVDVAEDTPPGALTGVLQHDPTRSAPGLTYLTSAKTCRSFVIDLEGAVQASWEHGPCRRWGNSMLLPGGEVLAVHSDPPEPPTPHGSWRARSLLKLNRDGAPIWKRRIPVHHDVEVTPSGRIATLTYRHRLVPAVHDEITVRDSYVALLTADGELIEEASLTDLLLASRDVLPLRRSRPRQRDWMLEVDLVHANSIEWMRHPQLHEQSPLYDAENFLVSMRSQDAVAIVNWPTQRIVWAWGRGELSGPHDATVLPDGNILVFDNGLARGWSRVVEVNPLTKTIVWQFRASPPEDFFSRTRGSAQRLANGNTLITSSESGIVFEVTSAGETVWLYRNPDLAHGKPVVVVRARRFEPADGSVAPLGLID